MELSRPIIGLAILLGLGGPILPNVALSEPLTLGEAEQRALEVDPAGERFHALAQAREEAAVAAGQLPDPQLTTRLMNVPADRLDLERDPMTQLQVGVRQTFPRGRTRHLASAREQARAELQRARAEDWERLLRKTVRQIYIEAFDHHAALEVLEASQAEFDRLVDITERQYAAGTAAPEDVSRARLERDLLDDRIAARRQALATARAELARWIGQDMAERPLPEERPEIVPMREAVPDPADAGHPLLQAERAEVRAGRQQVELAREAYKPQWAVELSYGLRGGGRSDFLSGMVMVDLPLFTGQRQDRRLAERQRELHAAQQSLAEQRRELTSRRETTSRRGDYFSARLDAFESRYIQEAEAHAEAALRSYQNDLTPFNAVVRAQLQVLETRLEALNLATEHARNQAERAYLAGGNP